MRLRRPLASRLSDLWPLCDAFDKCRGRYSMHTYYLSIVSPPHFMAPSLFITGQRFGASWVWRSETHVGALLSCLLSCSSAGNSMIALHGRCSSLTRTNLVARNSLVAVLPYVCPTFGRLIIIDYLLS